MMWINRDDYMQDRKEIVDNMNKRCADCRMDMLDSQMKDSYMIQRLNQQVDDLRCEIEKRDKYIESLCKHNEALSTTYNGVNNKNEQDKARDEAIDKAFYKVEQEFKHKVPITERVVVSTDYSINENYPSHVMLGLAVDQLKRLRDLLNEI